MSESERDYRRNGLWAPGSLDSVVLLHLMTHSNPGSSLVKVGD